MLTVLASSVVFAADAGHHVQEVDVAAAVGMAVALTVWTSRVGETPVVSEHLGETEADREGHAKNVQGRWVEASLGEGWERGPRSGCDEANSASFEFPGGLWVGSQGGQGMLTPARCQRRLLSEGCPCAGAD